MCRSIILLAMQWPEGTLRIWFTWVLCSGAIPVRGSSISPYPHPACCILRGTSLMSFYHIRSSDHLFDFPEIILKSLTEIQNREEISEVGIRSESLKFLTTLHYLEKALFQWHSLRKKFFNGKRPDMKSIFDATHLHIAWIMSVASHFLIIHILFISDMEIDKLLQVRQNAQGICTTRLWGVWA
jgi:hypothetical protein